METEPSSPAVVTMEFGQSKDLRHLRFPWFVGSKEVGPSSSLAGLKRASFWSDVMAARPAPRRWMSRT